MKITYWDIADAAKLTDFYNEEFANLPYCYPVSPEEFKIGVRYHAEEDKPYVDLSHEKLIVGEQDGEIVGFAHVAVLSFYRSGIHLKFERGKITEISSASPEPNNARFPDLTFLQLLCGRRRFNELAESFPDCGGTDEAAVLLDCLFPPFTGNVWELA